MIWDAEKRGVLKPGKELIEPTSGNTGIALAFVAAARGYPITLTMPETMSIERRKVLKAFGAKLLLTDGAKGMAGSIAKAEEIVASDPNRYRAAAAVQESSQSARSTWRPPAPRSGTIRKARSTSWFPASAPAARSPACRATSRRTWARRSSRSALSRRPAPLSRRLSANSLCKPGPHKIQGIGAGFIPDTLDLSMVDRVELVTNEESIETARRLASEEGILSGISCGAAVAVALRLARQEESSQTRRWS